VFSYGLHRISTVCGLPRSLVADSLNWLQAGMGLFDTVPIDLPETGKHGTLEKHEKHCFAPRHDWVAQNQVELLAKGTTERSPSV